jgi:hypothetical protein
MWQSQKVSEFFEHKLNALVLVSHLCLGLNVDESFWHAYSVSVQRMLEETKSAWFSNLFYFHNMAQQNVTT